jgi:SPP1 family holin
MKRLNMMSRNFMNDRALMIRVTVLFYALVNQFLIAAGYSPLPFAEGEVEEFVSMLITMASTVWVGYRNTNLSDEAVAAQHQLDEMKIVSKQDK